MSVLLKTSLFLSALTGAAVNAAPAPLEARQANQYTAEAANWNEGATTAYKIHESCNATQAFQIARGLNETIQLVSHAKDHVLRFGNTSEIYRKYFGDRPPFEVIGAYDIIVEGDKANVLFRCDNPDGNCAIEGYGGHWRGENATDETVICDLSYETRRPLSQMCALGYNVAESKTNTFWASDLLHRLYHMPAVGKEYIEHFATDHDSVIDLAASNETSSTHDSDTLQYFALEAYAHDIAIPGVGCPGPEHTHDDSDSSASSTAAPAPAATTDGATPTVSDAASVTSSIPPHCHTHEGGVLHCT
ncbi:Major allergen Asp f 2 [Exophiala dermatitidis]